MWAKEPQTNYWIMAGITLVPTIAGVVVAFIKRHLIIDWVKKKRKKK